MSKRVSRRKPYPGPVRGTPIGDEIIGPCRGEGCGTTLHRGDEFIVLVGDLLLCGKCRRGGVKARQNGL
jgi:hypothetical protein